MPEVILKALNGETLVVMGGAVKSLTDNTFELCMYKFTNAARKDLTHEYFDDETDFVESDYPFTGNLLYHHGLSSDVEIHPIGEIVSAERRAGDGIYGKGVIDFATRYKRYIKTLRQPAKWKAEQESLADEYQKYLEELNRKGLLAGSGGALPQSFVKGADGHIDRWCQSEYTLTPAPAEPEYTYTKVTPVKSLPTISLRELIAREADGTADDNETNVTEQSTSNKGNKAMNLDEIKQLIAAFAEQLLGMLGGGETPPPAPAEEEVKAAADEVAAEVEEEKEEAAAEGKSVSREQIEVLIEKKATELVERQLAAVARRQSRAQKAAADLKAKHDKGVSKVGGYSNPDRERPEDSRVQVGENLKYAHLSATDMAMAYKLCIAATPLGPKGIAGLSPTDFVSEDFYRHAVNKAYALHDKNPLVRIQEEVALKSARPFKANEMDASNITGQGVEYLGYFYDSVVWETARNQRIYELMQSRGMLEKEVPQGNKSTYVPVEGADPTVYGGGEANSTDATGRPEAVYKITPITTIQQTVTPGTFRAATADTLILQEDSIVDIAAESNRKLSLAMMENIEKAFLNADSETAINTNINTIDGTPTSTGLTADYYLQFNGLMKSPLVTSVAYKRDAGGALSLNDYLSTLSLFPAEQAARADNLFYVIDFYVRQASLKFPELKTREVAAENATIFTGTLPELWGIPVYMSGFLPKANTAGKVATTTPGNNTTGRILLVYAPYWAFTYKRNLTIETQRFPESESTAFYASMRFSLTRRSASASAISYNVGV